MDSQMRDIDQKIFNFSNNKNFKDEDFYLSSSNRHIYKMLNNWPKWEKNFLNIVGENFSGKTHLMNIFLKKFNGIKIESNSINNHHLNEIKFHQNIILENLDNNVNEELIYTLYNIVEQEDKFLIVTSRKSITDIQFVLNDLKSRTKNFIIQNIEKPDDELIFALLLKNLSDRQILIEKKFIDYIVKRIDRSYGKIFDLIYKIDKISLNKKKPIDFNIIKEVLGE